MTGPTKKVRLRRAQLLSWTVALVTLAGCGTTVPLAQQVSGSAGGSGMQGLPDGQGPSAQQGGATAPLGPDAALPGGSVSTGSPQPRAGSTAAPTRVGPSSAPTFAVPGATLPGITASTVSVGMAYVDTAAANTVVASTGAKGTGTGDTLAEHRAVANWINAHGGVAGRRLKLVEYKYNVNDDSTTASAAACASWTEDNKVAAGLDAYVGAGTRPLVECVAQHHALAIGTLYDVGARSDFQRYQPYYYAPASMELVAAGRTYVDGLAAQGYFAPGAKVGIAVYDDAEYREAMRDAVVPELRARGITKPDIVWITPPSGLSDQGRLVNDIAAAELKMAGDNVTHMLFLDGNASISFFFMKQAQSQRYMPRYGLSTLSYPSFLQSNFNGSQGPNQLSGALTVGWMPTEDLDVTHLPQSSARALCERIMKDAGLTATLETDLTIQLSICSEFFLLKAGLDGATELSATGFARAISSLGRTNVTAAAGVVDSYAPGKPWGAAQYWLGAYVDSCSCFTYRGAPHDL